MNKEGFGSSGIVFFSQGVDGLPPFAYELLLRVPDHIRTMYMARALGKWYAEAQFFDPTEENRSRIFRRQVMNGHLDIYATNPDMTLPPETAAAIRGRLGDKLLDELWNLLPLAAAVEEEYPRFTQRIQDHTRPPQDLDIAQAGKFELKYPGLYVGECLLTNGAHQQIVIDPYADDKTTWLMSMYLINRLLMPISRELSRPFMRTDYTEGFFTNHLRAMQWVITTVIMYHTSMFTFLQPGDNHVPLWNTLWHKVYALMGDEQLNRIEQQIKANVCRVR